MIRLHSRSVLLLIVLALFSLLAGCSKPVEKLPETIKISSGGAQYGAKGTETARLLEIIVLGPERRSAGGRRPVAGIPVAITPEGADTPIITGTSDSFGFFRTKVPYGDAFGDRYFTVSCPGYEKIEPRMFHLTAGLQIMGDSQQTIAGNELPDPIQVSVDGPNGPEAGIPVYFKIVSGSQHAKLTTPQAFTDKNGIAATQLVTDPDYTGKYEIIAEVGVKEQAGFYLSRGVYITALAMNRTRLAIALLGGLAFFIMGMTMMSRGLQMLAGAKLKNILQMFTGNRVTAIIAGAVITALIQASGATSVMVIGFVNAGLMSLAQGIGVIMGSAVGTTITGQMVSFKLDSLALPAVILGVTLLLLAKKSTMRGVAEAILGFGILFYGMTLMSTQSRVIADFPVFQQFFALFDCTPAAPGEAPPLLPVLGAILIGIVLTAIVQSSSVTVSLTIAIASSGLLSFWTAFPLVLGDNIGTTITALLATVGTNRTAKQTALSSTIFKIAGVVVMLILYYVNWHGVPCFLHLVDIITPGEVFAAHAEEVGRHIANAHTLFSFFCVVICAPFIPALAWIARAIVPDRKERSSAGVEICHLEQHLLNSPSAAMDQVLTALLAMTQASITQTQRALKGFIERSHAFDEKLSEGEAQIDRAQREIMDYLVKLMRRNLTEKQSSIIPDFMHCVNDVERVGDRAVNIAQLVTNEEAVSQKFSQHAIMEISQIRDRIVETGTVLIDAMSRNDQELINKVIKHCGEIKMLTARFESNHEARLNNRDCNVENGVIYVELLSNLERIAAHLSNLAERARQMLNHRVVFAGAAHKTSN